MEASAQLIALIVIVIGGAVSTFRWLRPGVRTLRDFGRKLDDIEEERKWVRIQLEPNGLSRKARTLNQTNRDVADQTLIEVRELRTLFVDHMTNPNAHHRRDHKE